MTELKIINFKVLGKMVGRYTFKSIKMAVSAWASTWNHTKEVLASQ